MSGHQVVTSELLCCASGRNYFRSHFTSVKNDQKLHCVITSYATKVVEKQQILILKKTFMLKIGVLRATIAQKKQKSDDFILLLVLTRCSE